MSIRVTGLFTYPVKGLKGISQDSALLTPTGLQWDRYWMIINAKQRFISQRQYPQMALINTELNNDHLILRATSTQDLKVPLNFTGDPKTFKATIWKDECQVISEGAEASEWLKHLLGDDQIYKLVRLSPQHHRPQSKPDIFGKETTTYFADAAPYLVCNDASLTSLNNSFTPKETFLMDRFRPNITISGCEAFDEHKISQLNHENFSLKLCYPCQRCAVPTINQQTAEKHQQQEPFRSLSSLNPMPDNPKAPAFGENAYLMIHSDTSIKRTMRLSIGESLTALYH